MTEDLKIGQLVFLPGWDDYGKIDGITSHHYTVVIHNRDTHALIRTDILHKDLDWKIYQPA